MSERRHSKRDSASSRISAILRPLDSYEPLTLAQLEAASQEAVEGQSELPTWSRRRSQHSERSLAARFSRSQSRHRSTSRYSVDPITRENAQMASDWTELSRNNILPDVSVLPRIRGRPTLDDEYDAVNLLLTPTHLPKRRSARLSGRSLASQTIPEISSAAHRLSGRPNRSLSRSDLRRNSQRITALPSTSAWDSSDVTEKGSIEIFSNQMLPSSPPIVPRRALSRITAAGHPAGPPAGPPSGPHGSKDPNLVLWDGPMDPGNPMNWPRSRKWACTIALGLVTFCVTFASSVFSAGTVPAAHYYNTSEQQMVLGTALFVLGFSFGPVIWGPMSELYGRKIPLSIGFVVFAVFQVPVAVAENLTTLYVCRFLAGFGGCSTLTIVGGALADFWNPIDRGIAVSIFACSTFLGPTLGPIVGGYLTENPNLGFRWNSWITLILSVVLGLLFWFVYPESFGPVLLQQRAKELRYETRNWALHAPADENKIDLKAIFSKYLSKPFVMLAMEPILLLITIYISFIYGILYLFFETYPFSFIGQRQWSLGKAGLPFIAVMVGVVAAGGVNLAFTKYRFAPIMQKTGRLPPEERLLPMAVGGVSLPIGLFWFAWTSFPSMNPWPQILAGIPTGMGVVLIFLQGLNYLIDCYLMHANSAIAGNTFVRSLVGFGFPMFAYYMYRDLGVQWATSALGFVALGLVPVPLLFFLYGERIRKMSRFVPKLPPGGMGPPGMGAGGPPPSGPPGGLPPAKDTPSAESSSTAFTALPKVVVSEKA